MISGGTFLVSTFLTATCDPLQVALNTSPCDPLPSIFPNTNSEYLIPNSAVVFFRCLICFTGSISPCSLVRSTGARVVEPLPENKRPPLRSQRAYTNDSSSSNSIKPDTTSAATSSGVDTMVRGGEGRERRVAQRPKRRVAGSGWLPAHNIAHNISRGPAARKSRLHPAGLFHPARPRRREAHGAIER